MYKPILQTPVLNLHPLPEAGDLLRRIDEACPRIVESLNALKLSYSGPEAREQLVRSISTTSDVTEALRQVASISDEVTRLLGELAQLLDLPPASIKKITSRLDFRDKKASQILHDLRGRIQGVLDRLVPHLPSCNDPSLPSASSNKNGAIKLRTTATSSWMREDNPPVNSLKWEKLLEPSKKILHAVSTAAPLIPGVGSYIKCGADSISALIDMLQGMTDNDSSAQILCDKIKRLAEIVAIFQDTGRPYNSEGTLGERLQSFEEHSNTIKRNVQEIQEQSSRRKIIYSKDNATTIANLGKTLDTAIAELQSYLGLDIHRMVRDEERDRLIDLLGDAEFGDVGHMKDDGLCLEGTRVDFLKKVEEWADDLSAPRALLLQGHAGRGKSTLARTAAAKFKERWGNKASCAIFHFRHNNTSLNTRSLLALVRQLLLRAEPQVGNALLEAVRDHKDVARARLQTQFEILFVSPFKKLKTYPPRVLFVIDALDECGDPALVPSLLRLIAEHGSSLPSSIKFLFASRPEVLILREFQAFKMHGVEVNLDTVGLAVMDSDLRTYFLKHLRQIRDTYALGESWLAEGSVDSLVSLSEGLFQWADTAMSYVKQAPELNLQELVDSRDVVCGLPRLYKRIFQNAFLSDQDVMDKKLPKLLDHILGTMVVTSRPISPAILAYLWNDSIEAKKSSKSILEIFKVLNPLRSMLILPNEESPDSPIHFMHTSVRDFLLTDNEVHFKNFQLPIDPAVHHMQVTGTYFRRMERDLKHDRYGIEDPSEVNPEVSDLVGKYIQSGLRYCCRSWSTQISQIKDDGNVGFNDVRKQLDEFCTQRLLHWLEVLSLIGSLSEVFDMIRRARDWLKKLEIPQSEASAKTSSLLGDTYDFCRRFYKLMAAYPKHISLSFLLHFPKGTVLRSVHATGQQTPRIVRGPAPRRYNRFRPLDAGVKVYCVAVSLDGKTFASGLDDSTIQLWDGDTGELKGKPLVGHSSSVLSVAFASDGKTMASGSRDGTIRLWNVDTGEAKGESLVGHTDCVQSIAFAPNGKILASGSRDTTIQLWYLDNGKTKRMPLVGHTSRVTCVAFTPDGTVMASGSRDRTIRLWDPETGELKGEPLAGHSDYVQSVAFTHNGKILASGSRDKTIQLWDPDTGNPKGKSLVGHTDSVSSVAFSPDGKTLASGSYDATIQLWDPDTGEPKRQSLVGHTSSVSSIVFTPDGKTLASGSYDKTVRLWYPNIGEPEGEPLVGHTTSVTSVAFAPDSEILATGSHDYAILLWDPETGKPKGKSLVDHSGPVLTVAFAPDGKTLISKSSSEILPWRLGYDVSTGSLPHSQQNGVNDVRQRGSSVRFDSKAGKPQDGGWIFIDEKRCFWLPEEFFQDIDDLRGDRVQVKITLFGRFLVFHHRNIHILDISAYL